MKQYTVEVNGISINYYDNGGDGLPVIMLHGNSLGALTFSEQLNAPELNAYRIIAPDFPGHGLSERSVNVDTDYSPKGLISFTVSFLKELGIEKCVLCGHSLGGHIAIESIPECDAVKGVCIWGAPPLGFPPAIDKAYLPNPVIMLAYQGTLTAEEAATLAAAFTADGYAGTDCTGMILKADPAFRTSIGTAIMSGKLKDESGIVSQMNIPLAVFHGEKEKLVNAAYFDSLNLPTLWQGKVQVIPGCGHSSQMEDADKFNALLLDFLKSEAL